MHLLLEKIRQTLRLDHNSIVIHARFGGIFQTVQRREQALRENPMRLTGSDLHLLRRILCDGSFLVDSAPDLEGRLCGLGGIKLVDTTSGGWVDFARKQRKGDQADGRIVYGPNAATCVGNDRDIGHAGLTSEGDCVGDIDHVTRNPSSG